MFADVGGMGGLSPEWLPHLEKIQPVIFEPNPSQAAVVRASIAGSANGLVVETALGNTSEIRTLHVTKSLGCTSLLKPNKVVLERYSIQPAFAVTGTVEVECQRYDALIAQGLVPIADAIKIDVQGFKYQVLEGFGSTIRSCLAVKVEAHLYPIYEGQKLLHDLTTYLGHYGFVLMRIEPVNHFDGDLVEVDAWFGCDERRVATLSDEQAAKWTLIREVWDLPDRRATFGKDQFA